MGEEPLKFDNPHIFFCNGADIKAALDKASSVQFDSFHADLSDDIECNAWNREIPPLEFKIEGKDLISPEVLKVLEEPEPTFDITAIPKPEPIGKVPRKWKKTITSNRNTKGYRKFINLAQRKLAEIKAYCFYNATLKGCEFTAKEMKLSQFRDGGIAVNLGMRGDDWELVCTEEQMELLKKQLGIC